MKKFTSFLFLFALLLLLLWAFNTCNPRHTPATIGKESLEKATLAEVFTKIYHLNGKAVIVQGRVLSNVFLLGRGSYELEDPTGTLRVLTNTQPPLQGSTVIIVIEPRLLAAYNGYVAVIANELKLLFSENEVTTNLDDEAIRL